MDTNIRLWSHLVQFFAEWEYFSEQMQRNSKHTFCVQFLFFLSKILQFRSYCEKSL